MTYKIAVIPGEKQGVIYTTSADDMVMKIVSLLESPERRQQLEQAGLKYVKRAHGHDKIARKLETYLEEAIKQGKTR